MLVLHRLLLLLLPLLWAGSLQQEPRYTLHVQQSVTVQQGLCVLVPCSFSYPVSFWPPPRQTYMSWFQITYYLYDGEPVATSNPKHMLQPKIKGRFHLLGDVRTRNCSLHIRGARMEDAGYYVFRIETSKNNHVYADNAVNLRVTALTEKPVLLMPEALQSGRATTLSCVLPGSCPGGPPLTFSWSGSALHSVDPGSLSSSELTLTPRPRDHNSSLTCQVKVGGAGANLERTIRLNVSYAPQDLTISVFFRNGTALKIVSNGSSLSLPEEQSLRLVCEADSNPPAKLSWNWKGKEGPGPSQVSGSGVLELAHARAEDGGAFTCQAQHVLGSRHLLLTLSVQRSLRTCICEAERQEGSWPLALTLIRGALMGTGFLLTYGLTRIYYTRCAGGAPGHSSEKPHRAP